MIRLLSGLNYNVSKTLTLLLPLGMLFFVVLQVWFIDPELFVASEIAGNDYLLIQLVNEFFSSWQFFLGITLYGMLFIGMSQYRDLNHNKQFQHLFLTGTSRSDFFFVKYVLTLLRIFAAFLVGLILVTAIYALRIATALDNTNVMSYFINYWNVTAINILIMFFIFQLFFTLTFALGYIFTPKTGFIAFALIVGGILLFASYLINFLFGLELFSIIHIIYLFDYTIIENGERIHQVTSWMPFMLAHFFLAILPMIFAYIRFTRKDIN